MSKSRSTSFVFAFGCLAIVSVATAAPTPVAPPIVAAPKTAAPAPATMILAPGSTARVTKVTPRDAQAPNVILYPGIPVTIDGNGFGAAGNGRTVAFEVDGKTFPMPVSVWSATSIRAHLPVAGLLGFGPNGGAPSNGKVTVFDGKVAIATGPATIQMGSENDHDGDGHRGIGNRGDDCDDHDPNRYPGRAEVADFLGHDEDCDPHTIGVLDTDRDTFTDSRVWNVGGQHGEDCDDTRREVHPGQIEACNNRDDNCNSRVDEELLNCPSATR